MRKLIALLLVVASAAQAQGQSAGSVKVCRQAGDDTYAGKMIVVNDHAIFTSSSGAHVHLKAPITVAASQACSERFPALADAPVKAGETLALTSGWKWAYRPGAPVPRIAAEPVGDF